MGGQVTAMPAYRISSSALLPQRSQPRSSPPLHESHVAAPLLTGKVWAQVFEGQPFHLRHAVNGAMCRGVEVGEAAREHGCNGLVQQPHIPAESG